MVAAWSLVATRAKCEGTDEEAKDVEASNDRLDGPKECAKKCHGVSSMFRFQMGGGDPNLRDSVNCYCEKSATEEGTCQFKRIAHFSLYKFTNIGKATTHLYLRHHFIYYI